MILKTKKNFSLTLDDEFIKYCEINNINDVEKLAKETFNVGFNILKYGKEPPVGLTKKEEIKPTVETKKEVDPEPVIVTPKPSTKPQKDIYGE